MKKIRVWDKINKEYLHYPIMAVTLTKDGELIVTDKKKFIIEFSIGITDKNGIDIFEGDYLVNRFPIDDTNLSKGYYESLLQVVWCKKQLCWCVDVSFKKDGSYLTPLVEYFGEHLEIKGNINNG